MEGILDQASDGSAEDSSRHTEAEGPELLPDDCPHVEDDSKPLGRFS
jgi:hypothetical protein